MAEDLNAKAQRQSSDLIAIATKAAQLKVNLNVVNGSGNTDATWQAAQAYRGQLAAGYAMLESLVETCAAAIEANAKIQLAEQVQTERTGSPDPV